MDPWSIIGVPPIILLYVMVKCAYEVEHADGVSEHEKNALWMKCVLDNVIPTGIPDPDAYNRDDN